MKERLRIAIWGCLWGMFLCSFVSRALAAIPGITTFLTNAEISVTVNSQNGSYEIRANGLKAPVLSAQVGAEVNHRWLRSSDYPHHEEVQSAFHDPLGAGRQMIITFNGLHSEPDLVCILRLYNRFPYGTVRVQVLNHTSKTVSVQAIRNAEAIGNPRINLGGPPDADRFLFESYSENPPIKIGGLDQAPQGGYLGVRDALVYNLLSKQSLLLAALTEDRFLTILHLGVQRPPMGSSAIGSFTVDSTGTTEITRTWDHLTPPQQVWLSLAVAPGSSLSSERLMFAAGPHYHAQLEAYGRAVRLLDHARVSAMAPRGWWSWTAFYADINEGEVLTNAQWLARHLKSLGYDFFHIDEGYDYARGEYITTNATQFPDGMREIGYKITHLGLKLGLWTAPFEVSQRAWVYEHHKDWLVHDAHGQPIMIGFVDNHVDALYALDTTNPGAQEYLRKTYRILTRQWGARYIKLDFMDAADVEGYRYRPNTTALEAQRIGLEIIRQAVGNRVLLDKDGSPMLAPVGIVNEGRISLDTGHSFAASRGADPNIAARFYMDDNFYTSDPDAFNISTEVEPEESWHNQKTPLTFNEAEVQIVLAAMAGGMYEIGDDLPTLGATPRRLALAKNRDLLHMVELGHAAIPVDLMTFSVQDEMPSVYFLREDARQSMLAIFNFTKWRRSHTLELSALGLPARHPYEAYEVLNADAPVNIVHGSIAILHQAPRSVTLIKIIDTSVPAAAPSVAAIVPKSVSTGEAMTFRAYPAAHGVPALSYDWHFGDGTTASGRQVTHTYTRAADYNVKLIVAGMDGIPAVRAYTVAVRGALKTAFHLHENRRFVNFGNQ